MTRRLIRKALIPAEVRGLGADARASEECDVLIDGGTIVAVEPNLVADADETLEAEGMVLIPGLIDTHSHMWESMFRGRLTRSWSTDYFVHIKPYAEVMSPDDVYASNYLGATEYLNNGVTAVFDYFHCSRSSAHLEAAIAADRDAGIRAVIGLDLHERINRYDDDMNSYQKRYDHAVKILSDRQGDDELISFALCLSEFTAHDVTKVAREIAMARDLGAQIAFHCDGPDELAALGDAGLLGPDIMAIHGNYATSRDLEALAAVEGYLTFQPQIEVFSGRRPMSMFIRAHQLGIHVALGVDVPTLGKPSLLEEMRVTQVLSRYLDGQKERAEGRFPIARRAGTPSIQADDVLRFATRNGAEAIGLGATVGMVLPGFQADLTLIDTAPFGTGSADAAAYTVMMATSGDVATVMVNGEFKKRNGALVGVDLEAMRSRVDSALSAVESRVRGLDEQTRQVKTTYSYMKA